MEGHSDQNSTIISAIEHLSDEEILEAILDLHKPSKNPVVRWLWTALGSIFVVFVDHWNDSTRMADNIVVGLCRVLFWPIIEEDVSMAFDKPIVWECLCEYYKAGRALPLHSKIIIIGIISFVSACSIYVVTKLGDPGFGQATIAIVAVIGIWFVGWKVPTVQLQPQPN